MPPAWRIYYANGETFDSDDGAPIEAPVFGVICAISPNASDPDKSDPSHLTVQWDRFYWHPVHKEWWGGHSDVADQRLANGDPIEAIKFGVNIDTPTYKAIVAKADEDRVALWGGRGPVMTPPASLRKGRGPSDDA